MEETKASLQEEQKKKFLISKNAIIFIVALALLIAVGITYKSKTKNVLSQDAVKTKVENFVRDNLIQPGAEFSITKIEKQGSLYKMTLSVGGQGQAQEIEAYATNDGKLFFPQAIDMDEKKDEANSQKTQAATEASVKNAVPEVELFVMSQCPYGVQAEKGILPAIQKLGSKVNFKLKFVDYILHGQKEFDENLNQYCIQKEEPGKLSNYLSCYNISGDSAKCSNQAKINKTKITSCVNATDKSLGLTEKFKSNSQNPPFGVDADLNEKYGVQGSPTLVVNGTVINSGRDSASYLKAICSGFENQPAECSAALSSTAPAAGFGDGTAVAGAGTASCGN
ncbi:MAG: hypothetical protein WC906_05195 [Parcubacteria group bacterium]|jgi:hypothetical protein